MDQRTTRLRIREWRLAEAPRLQDIRSRAEVMKWLGDDEPDLTGGLAEAEDKIASFAERSVVPPLGFWAIEVVETGTVAGTVLLWTLPNASDGEVEIGWWLHPDSWGQGIASEAAGAVLRSGFEGGLSEIIAVTHLDNYPSQAVARRIGMRHLGRTDRWYDSPSELFVARPEDIETPAP